jgi:hypothetical protein
MIENYQVNEQTKEVTGIFGGESFSMPPRYEDGNLVALTSEECEAVLTERKELKKLADDNAYKHSRAAEYPPITDYIDGVVKGDQAQIQAYIDACLAVKAKYPKEQA